MDAVELTREQTAVLTGLARGQAFAVIARQLDVTVRNVRLWFRESMVALNAATETHTVAIAIGYGLLPADVAVR